MVSKLIAWITRCSLTNFEIYVKSSRVLSHIHLCMTKGFSFQLGTVPKSSKSDTFSQGFRDNSMKISTISIIWDWSWTYNISSKISKNIYHLTLKQFKGCCRPKEDFMPQFCSSNWEVWANSFSFSFTYNIHKIFT